MRVVQRSSYTDEFADIEKLGRVKTSSTLKLLNPILVDGGLLVDRFEAPDDYPEESSRGYAVDIPLPCSASPCWARTRTWTTAKTMLDS